MLFFRIYRHKLCTLNFVTSAASDHVNAIDCPACPKVCTLPRRSVKIPHWFVNDLSLVDAYRNKAQINLSGVARFVSFANILIGGFCVLQNINFNRVT